MRTQQLSDGERTRSVLIHTRSGAATPDRASVILLHGRYGDHTELDDLKEVAAEERSVYSLRAPRTQTSGHDIVGYYWYVGDTPCQPEASTFGDALQQVERFILDRAEENSGEGFVLIGRDEGAVLALVLAGVWPELVRGVGAINPCVIDVPKSWELPQRSLDGMSVLLTASDSWDEGSPSRLTSMQQHFESKGAHVLTSTAAQRVEVFRDWLKGL